MSTEKESNTNSKEVTLEERFGRLEAIVGRLKSEDVTMDEAFLLYKEGVEEAKRAGDALEKIEKEMLILREDGQLEEL